MKIFIMTDMEGSCGILDHDNWVMDSGRYYEEGKELLTMEVNAAVEGFFSAGANEIYVMDGHGAGGIHHSLLDPRTSLIKKNPPQYPLGLDVSFDAIAWIGQHAKAGTAYAHIAHTQWFDYIDLSINGISIGEFGQLALIALSFGVTPIFGAGDAAFTREAKALIKGIETVEVKRGLNAGSGDECDCDSYRNRNNGAIHLHPIKARELIREGAMRALTRFTQDKSSFAGPVLHPPYHKQVRFRTVGNKPGYQIHQESDDLPALIGKNDREE